MNTETLTCTADSRYTVVLDAAQAFPEDPGQGTPAMVHGPQGSGTFVCVLDTGEMDGHRVPAFVSLWLESIADHVDDFVDAAFDAARAGEVA